MQPDPHTQIIIPKEKSRQRSILRDLLGVAAFIIAVVAGALILNAFVFQTYSVLGPSMEDTLYTNDRLLVNKLPVSAQHLRGQAYLPERGTVIVFSNPLYATGQREEYLVKRVIGLPGERVVLRDGIITVYNQAHPDGFQPDTQLSGPKAPTSGTADVTVPRNQVFVAGDNRVGEFSFDSRNGLGTIPLRFVQGPVVARLFPLTHFRVF